MERVRSPRDHELLVAARHIAVALGYTAADVTGLAVELGGLGRRDWPTADLLLIALAELARREPGRADLVGAVEAGEILGVSRARVHQLAERPDFPAPRYVLAAGKLWDRADIAAFGARWRRRPGRPRKPGTGADPRLPPAPDDPDP
ncbi:hypothetical protein Sme01_00320 [Sphaerisporangium melleum]|uniref:Uncharacterized protein n=1 Tax=Sphaerisporangium melleum TaxID=321316 RepID=A0A917RI94_9ACTN|nr:hypothetical protein [Sphaerisporangium melleum]GGL09360.1 hypothetical protein GCM10007964_59540 [Sphaerisporangium melleum]GII67556.1 hypothetical protein Sme01_00320 [Sphaerisporangium melleum]